MPFNFWSIETIFAQVQFIWSLVKSVLANSLILNQKWFLNELSPRTIISKRNWAESKVKQHATASRDHLKNPIKSYNSVWRTKHKFKT